MQYITKLHNFRRVDKLIQIPDEPDERLWEPDELWFCVHTVPGERRVNARWTPPGERRRVNAAGWTPGERRVNAGWTPVKFRVYACKVPGVRQNKNEYFYYVSISIYFAYQKKRLLVSWLLVSWLPSLGSSWLLASWLLFFSCRLLGCLLLGLLGCLFHS